MNIVINHAIAFPREKRRYGKVVTYLLAYQITNYHISLLYSLQKNMKRQIICTEGKK